METHESQESVTCGNCKRFARTTPEGGGVCKARPPKLVILPSAAGTGGDLQIMGMWPPTNAKSGACGKWRRK
jgi:hypothetical protein